MRYHRRDRLKAKTAPPAVKQSAVLTKERRRDQCITPDCYLW
jgi:hypothetical protein